jgi:hypothetical protein
MCKNTIYYNKSIMQLQLSRCLQYLFLYTAQYASIKAILESNSIYLVNPVTLGNSFLHLHKY